MRVLKWPMCELWQEPMVSGSPRRVGNILAQRFASWSPDGGHIAYALDRELHLADRDGTEIRKLATFADNPQIVRWSPDGRKVAVSARSAPGKPARLWLVQPEGTGLREALPGWNPDWDIYNGVWTPDGRYFVFLSNQKIWVVRERAWLRRGGEPVQLDTGLLEANYPLPSLDGKRLFFEGFQARNEFLRYDPGSRRFSLDLAGIWGMELEFSKDGKWITYVSVPKGTLFRAVADGTQRHQLTWPPLAASMPRWSPDGKQIAFTAYRPGTQRRIYVMPTDGGTPRQISNGEAGPHGDWDPTWSPDGASLAFGATVWEKPAEKFIHVIDLKTNRVSTLPGTQGMQSPRWSPDVRFIAGAGAILYDLQTRKQTPIFNQGYGYPLWSRSGEYLFCHADSGFWRIRVSDRKAELVAAPNDFTPANWGWYVLDPDDNLITSRFTGTADIFALDWELP